MISTLSVSLAACVVVLATEAQPVDRVEMQEHLVAGRMDGLARPLRQLEQHCLPSIALQTVYHQPPCEVAAPVDFVCSPYPVSGRHMILLAVLDKTLHVLFVLGRQGFQLRERLCWKMMPSGAVMPPNPAPVYNSEYLVVGHHPAFHHAADLIVGCPAAEPQHCSVDFEGEDDAFEKSLSRALWESELRVARW